MNCGIPPTHPPVLPAVPSLIRLLHGNRHTKMFLSGEFVSFWQRKAEEAAAAGESGGEGVVVVVVNEVV